MANTKQIKLSLESLPARITEQVEIIGKLCSKYPRQITFTQILRQLEKLSELINTISSDSWKLNKPIESTSSYSLQVSTQTINALLAQQLDESTRICQDVQIASEPLHSYGILTWFQNPAEELSTIVTRLDRNTAALGVCCKFIKYLY